MEKQNIMQKNCATVSSRANDRNLFADQGQGLDFTVSRYNIRRINSADSTLSTDTFDVIIVSLYPFNGWKDIGIGHRIVINVVPSAIAFIPGHSLHSINSFL